MPNDGFPPSRPDGTNHGISHNSITQPDRVRSTLEDMPRAAQLRAAGLTFREIGERLGCDHTWARTLVLKALQEATYEAADVMRTLVGMRYDRLLATYYPRAVGQNPDQKAADLVLRALQGQRQLFGLDAPMRVDVADVTDEVREMAEALGVSLVDPIGE